MSNAPSPVLLVSTDFDGTLVEHGAPAPFSPRLLEVFTALRERGVRWVINTGRSLASLEEGLESFALPIQPDFAITTEREVFRPASNGRGWEDFGDWNSVCAQRHDALFAGRRANAAGTGRLRATGHRGRTALRTPHPRARPRGRTGGDRRPGRHGNGLHRGANRPTARGLAGLFLPAQFHLPELLPRGLRQGHQSCGVRAADRGRGGRDVRGRRPPERSAHAQRAACPARRLSGQLH